MSTSYSLTANCNDIRWELAERYLVKSEITLRSRDSVVDDCQIADDSCTYTCSSLLGTVRKRIKLQEASTVRFYPKIHGHSASCKRIVVWKDEYINFVAVIGKVCVYNVYSICNSMNKFCNISLSKFAQHIRPHIIKM